MYRHFKRIGSSHHISALKPKRLSDEIMNSPTTSDNSLASPLSYTDTKTRLKFDGSCSKQDKTTFTQGNSVNIYVAYKINMWNYVGSSNPTLENSLFGAFKLVKNTDIDKYKYSGYGIGFDMKRTFSFPTGGFGKNVFLYMLITRKKYILILDKGPTQH